MGVVYKARQRGLNRLVAVKMIIGGSQARVVHLARFRIEAEAVARLRHPNILQIYDIGEVDGLPFVALELLEGDAADPTASKTADAAPENAATPAAPPANSHDKDCANARSNLELLQSKFQVSVTGSDGKAVSLDDKARAAQALGIHLSTLYRKVQRYRLDGPPNGAGAEAAGRPA